VFARATAAGIAAMVLPTRTSRALAEETVTYTLTAAPRVFSPVSGIRAHALAYNGNVPGPVLRVQHGQRVRIRYVNKTGEATSVHWHGMILPNAMDGVAGLTQPPVGDGETFYYEFAPNPPGTRWYHDHANASATVRGLFGLFVVEDPRDAPADAEFAIVLHDVPSAGSLDAAMAGTSGAPMVDPAGSPEMRSMRMDDKMGDEVGYTAHCINGASYPKTAPLRVKVGQRVRLRVLNANQTQTRYLRLAEHRLHVTHADGNPLARPLDVDVLRIGVGERFDAWFEVRKPGAWLLQGLSSDPLAFEQATVVRTEGMENASPAASSQSVEDVEYFTYERAAGLTHGTPADLAAEVRKHFTIAGGAYGSSRWTLDGKTWPDTEKIHVSRNDTVLVRFTNKTDMDHPMHLHGHTFEIVEIDGRMLQHPLAKDISLVRAGGGTMTWRFRATSPPGRWLLHCHNEIHMMDGMMTEVVYT
jgi:FtsP/CotA-like multicopper oxidase with cupredoxin domain